MDSRNESNAAAAGFFATAPTTRTLEDALHEVVHDERRISQEAAGRGVGGGGDADRHFVPFALAEGADGDLVAVEPLVTGADLLAVDPQLVGAREVADVDADGFLEQVSLVLREEAALSQDPRAVPSDLVVAFPGAGNLHGLPVGGLRGGEKQEEEGGKSGHELSRVSIPRQ